MSSQNPWEGPAPLQNTSQFMRNQYMGTLNAPGRPTPVLPPRPVTGGSTANSYSMMPYSMSSYGGGSPYGGGYSSYGMGMPYRSSLYGSNYGGGYGMNQGMYNYNSAFSQDDHERRFIHYAEESSRQTFASVEGVVRAFNSLAMMLDNTFFAMTSSFRAILGVAENFGRLRSMFGHIWYSVNIFRFLTWLYRKFRQMLGLKVAKNATSVAWKEAAGTSLPSGAPSGGSSWPTLAFLGVIVSAPYIISKFLPKYEDKLDPQNWKSAGIPAKACFDFIATNQNELTIHTNDNITLAPTYLQEEMHLRNTGWAYAVHNGKSGVIPLNYIVINKNNNNNNNNVPVLRASNIKDTSNGKTHQKKVSFGNIEIFDGGEEGVRKESIPVENEAKIPPPSDVVET